jgi:hypothetical protein
MEVTRNKMEATRNKMEEIVALNSQQIAQLLKGPVGDGFSRQSPGFLTGRLQIRPRFSYFLRGFNL